MRFPHIKYVHRSSIDGLRMALGKLGAVAAEVNEELRYVWIDNMHPDFNATNVIGKRDDELMSKADAYQIASVKRETFDHKMPMARMLCFTRSDGLRYYGLFTYPIMEGSGTMDTILTVGFDILPQTHESK